MKRAAALLLILAGALSAEPCQHRWNFPQGAPVADIEALAPLRADVEKLSDKAWTAKYAHRGRRYIQGLLGELDRLAACGVQYQPTMYTPKPFWYWHSLPKPAESHRTAPTGEWRLHQPPRKLKEPTAAESRRLFVEWDLYWIQELPAVPMHKRDIRVVGYWTEFGL